MEQVTENAAPRLASVPVSETLTAINGFFVPIAQTGLTLSLIEISRNVPTEVLSMAAIGLLAVAVVAGYFIEVQTLKAKGYTNNSAAAVAGAVWHNPWVDVGVATVVNYARGLFTAQDAWFMRSLLFSRTFNQEAVANLISRTIVGFSVAALENFAIQRGYAEPLVNAVEKIAAPIKQKFTHRVLK